MYILYMIGSSFAFRVYHVVRASSVIFSLPNLIGFAIRILGTYRANFTSYVMPSNLASFTVCNHYSDSLNYN